VLRTELVGRPQSREICLQRPKVDCHTGAYGAWVATGSIGATEYGPIMWAAEHR
jgi:hypothetical protein